MRTVEMIDKFSKDIDVSIRFQRLAQTPDNIGSWTVGLPDQSFPECDACITYSDNPYLHDLVKLPQVKKVILNMLSYGMAIERERKNILTSDITITCSTKKLEKAILEEGVKVNRIGFSLDTMSNMYLDKNIERKNFLAIMYHQSIDKRYNLAVDIADDLYYKKLIDGVITFGAIDNYHNSKKPKGLIKHYSNATRDEIREIFNLSKCFLMPSVTEGLNLTPIESTLCGCPSIICDGAIDELFFDKKTCMIAEKDNIKNMTNLVIDLMQNFNEYSDFFRINISHLMTEYTFEKLIKKLEILL
jgi:glycosyltransferase involved in cell wall biosynthesis